ncbi:Defensin-like protein 183 [Camellia lanceoleosa]|uniref:Defensin-like protein 183 n=1 Tax=Camellia lanceoleosa TaxID=1840588 RepID=A0ACC0I2J4_9ERIC|nr:Defensin-like protein 183 [Camellia lanceoleosa]
MMVPVAKSETRICTDGLGLCGKDCNQRCVAKHPGGQGTCDPTIKPELCSCQYNCDTPPNPPKQKRCNAGLGQCSFACQTHCCNDKCAKMFKNGQGFCDDNAGVNLCQCQYDC